MHPVGVLIILCVVQLHLLDSAVIFETLKK